MGGNRPRNSGSIMQTFKGDKPSEETVEEKKSQENLFLSEHLEQAVRDDKKKPLAQRGYDIKLRHHILCFAYGRSTSLTETKNY